MKQIEKFVVGYTVPKDGTFADGVDYILEKLDAIPEADVEPVKHGKWCLQEDGKHSCCSICNFMRNISTQYGWTYCPHCGAKMDEEENE